MGLQNIAKFAHIGIETIPVKTHAADHVAAIAWGAVDRKPGAIRTAMDLCIHHFDQVVADCAR